MNDKACPMCERDYVGLECSYCGADAGQHLFTELAAAREEVERLWKRDCNGTVELCYEKDGNPFHREDCPVLDVGVADNVYVVSSETVSRLQAENGQWRRRTEAAEAIVRWFEDDHDEDHYLEKPDGLERLYEELDAAMLGTT